MSRWPLVVLAVGSLALGACAGSPPPPPKVAETQTTVPVEWAAPPSDFEMEVAQTGEHRAPAEIIPVAAPKPREHAKYAKGVLVLEGRRK